MAMRNPEKEIDASTDRGLTRLTPDELDYVTMAATVDVSALSPPRVNYLLDRADTVENRFQEAVVKVRGVVGEDTTVRCENGEKGPCPWFGKDHASVEITVDVSDMDREKTEGLLEQAEKFENEFRDVVREYATPCA